MRELVEVFGRIGVLSFGGPAAQISLMHRELVDQRQWLSEAVFLRALSLCMMLPGPEAMQLATYAGWRLRGTLGGLVAGLLFVLPGALVITLLGLIYVAFGQLPLVEAAFLGIKATVIIIVIQALLRLSAKALVGPVAWALAGFSFIAVFAIGIPYPAVVFAAAVVGAIALKRTVSPDPLDQPTTARPLPVLLLWLSLWSAPIVVLALFQQAFLLDVALFFSKLAIVTFGGAYAVLAYMTQAIVSDYGWISTTQMMDALGLAETTPGPLILVTQFVALIAGHAQGGIEMALLAAMTTLWVTFVPCFLWIFLAGPYVERIAEMPRLAAALDGITAAVVGVILNLALWFAIHVLFDTVRPINNLALPVPELSSLDVLALLLTALAAVLLLWLQRGLIETLAVMALSGLVLGTLV